MAGVPRPSRVVVLYGGQSAEHDVSCVSARFVTDALGVAGYEALPVGITRDGRWVDVSALSASGHSDEPLPSPDVVDAANLLGRADLTSLSGGDVVAFPVLHGPMGEDGTVQGYCEVVGLPYVGAGVLASSLCMDKAAAKEILSFHGLPQVPWQSSSAADVDAAFCDSVASDLGLPLFVKPANLGSSIGISKVSDRTGLEVAVALAARYDDHLVFEQGVDAREIEVAVLGNAEPRASLPGEIETKADFYDYDDKYESDTATLHVPAHLDDGEAATVQDLATKAFRALRVEGMARVDFFLDPLQGFFVNEVNTIPGFTPISMYPRLWEATGVPAPELVDRLVLLATERHARRSARRTQR